MDQCGLALRPINPVICSPIRVAEVGIVAVMTIMSQTHYALIVCMHDSAIEQNDLRELRDEIAVPLIERFPEFIRSYQSAARGQIESFARYEPGEEYFLKVLSDDEVVFGWPEHLFGVEISTLWYLYIAPADVRIEEFLNPSSQYLN